MGRSSPGFENIEGWASVITDCYTISVPCVRCCHYQIYQLWVLGFDFSLGMLETRARDWQMYVNERGGNPKSPLGWTMYSFHTRHVEKDRLAECSNGNTSEILARVSL
jgi:hypothetical protein